MTKKEWATIRQDTKVWTNHFILKKVDEKVISETVFITGFVKRINSNGSQVLVDWMRYNNLGRYDNWHGRLSIDLMETFPK